MAWLSKIMLFFRKVLFSYDFPVTAEMCLTYLALHPLCLVRSSAQNNQGGTQCMLVEYRDDWDTRQWGHLQALDRCEPLLSRWLTQENNSGIRVICSKEFSSLCLQVLFTIHQNQKSILLLERIFPSTVRSCHLEIISFKFISDI